MKCVFNLFHFSFLPFYFTFHIFTKTFGLFTKVCAIGRHILATLLVVVVYCMF